MLARTLVPIVVALAAASVSAQNEWHPFDVAGGKLIQLLRVSLEPNSGIECRVRFSDLRYEEVWGPSFSIVLAEKGDLRKDAEDEHLFQLSMTVAEKDHGRIYDIAIHGFEESYSSSFLGLTGDVEEHIIRLDWRDDGIFSYFASEGSNGYGQGYILDPRLFPKTVIVSASGLIGEYSRGEFGI